MPTRMHFTTPSSGLQRAFAGCALLACLGTTLGFSLATAGYGWRAQLVTSCLVLLGCAASGLCAEDSVENGQRAELARLYAAAERGHMDIPLLRATGQATRLESLGLAFLDMIGASKTHTRQAMGLTAWARAMRAAIEARQTEAARLSADLGADTEVIVSAAQSSATAERQLAESLTGLREHADSATTSTEALVTEAETLADAVRAVTAQTERAAGIATRLSETAFSTQKGVAGMAEAAASMAQIAEQVQAVLGRAEMLGLNAGIEAARAGEAGRSFAVVAGEVKALASNGHAALDGLQQTTRVLKTQASEVFQRVHDISDVIQAQHEFGHALSHAAMLQADAVGRLITKIAAARGDVGQLQQDMQALELPRSTLGAGAAAQQAMQRLPGYAEAMAQILRGLPGLNGRYEDMENAELDKR